MYTVKVNYCGRETVEKYRTRKEVNVRFYGWYEHGLDMCGQAWSTFEAKDGRGRVIITDRY